MTGLPARAGKRRMAMVWSAKKVNEMRAAKSKGKIDWAQYQGSKGHGKVSAAGLREIIVRLETGYDVDVGVLIPILDDLKDVLLATAEANGDPTMSVDEIREAVQGLEDARRAATEEESVYIEELKAEIAMLETAREESDKDHEEDMAAVSQTADEFKKRAERAEHDLAEAVKNGHGLDKDAAGIIKGLELQIDIAKTKLEKISAAAPGLDVDAIVLRLSSHRGHALLAAGAEDWKKSAADWRLRAEAAEEREAALTEALAHARAENPIKRRKAGKKR